MPLRWDTDLAPDAKWDNEQADHVYWDLDKVWDHADAPKINSLTIAPSAETPTQRAARGANPTNTIAWDVAPLVAAIPGDEYNFGTVLTAGIGGARNHRVGWSDGRGGGGSVSIPVASGDLDFLNYFRVAGTTVPGPDLLGRYYLRTTPDAATNPPVWVEVNGERYTVVTRASVGAGLGFVTSRNDVPAFEVGQTYNVQVGYQDGTTAWPNTQVHADPPTPAVYPALALSVTTQDGTRTPLSIGSEGVSNTTVSTPQQDMVAELRATNAGRHATEHASFHYNVPAAITAFSVSLLRLAAGQGFAGQPTATFTGNTLTRARLRVGTPADVAGGGGTIHDLLRHNVSGGSQPNWNNWGITGNPRPFLGAHFATPTQVAVALDIATRDGAADSRTVTVNVPAGA